VAGAEGERRGGGREGGGGDWRKRRRERDGRCVDPAIERKNLEKPLEKTKTKTQKPQTYANSKEVILVGDMPIYVGGHSADVWAHRDLFALGDDGSPRAVSGVPPDAFSDTGQLWGSPLYDWPAHQREGFSWWARRLERARELYDLTRVDHFRAFAGYWSVPAGAGTAMEGSWVSGPGRELFDAVRGKIGEVAIIAEDLGVITPDVTEARLSFFFVAVPLFRPRTGRRISDKETHSRHPASSLSNRPPIHHS
jgi:4-alpha-glucanotransferase